MFCFLVSGLRRWHLTFLEERLGQDIVVAKLTIPQAWALGIDTFVYVSVDTLFLHVVFNL